MRTPIFGYGIYCPVRYTKVRAPREDNKRLFGSRTSELVIFIRKKMCAHMGYAVSRLGCCDWK